MRKLQLSHDKMRPSIKNLRKGESVVFPSHRLASVRATTYSVKMETGNDYTVKVVRDSGTVTCVVTRTK